jgi:hypothetical protein
MKVTLSAGLLAAAVATVASAADYTGVGGSIPDAAPGFSSVITITDSFSISDITFEIQGLTHTWAGDLVATVSHAESGFSIDLFNRIGKTNATSGFGDSSDMAGNYGFGDSAASNLWAAAAATTGPVPAGFYRSSGALSGTATSILAIFGGDNIKGSWTLTITDGAGGDVGAFTGWKISAVPAPSAIALLGLAGLVSRRRRA